jgi:hypothetical protein
MRARLRHQDDHAAERGWTVGRGRWGGRTYRDPRFDFLGELSVLGEAIPQEVTETLTPEVAR